MRGTLERIAVCIRGRRMMTFGRLIILLSFAVSFGFPALAQTKPALTKFKDTKIRLAYQGKSAIVDLEDIHSITLGSDRWHRYRVFFTAVKNGKIHFLFEEQGGSPMSNPMSACGGDSPRTLIWLKTDFKLRVEVARSEVFASCAYNGGRHQQGKTRIVGSNLSIRFKEQREQYEITYDNRTPEKPFEVRNL